MPVAKYSATSTPLILLLIYCLAAYPAHAWSGDRNGGSAVRPYSMKSTGPIGRIIGNSLSYSGAVMINGQPPQGEQLIWDGDLIETTSGGNVRALINLIGQVKLGSNGRLRLAARFAGVDTDGDSHTLIASLVEGDMEVNLEKGAAAYIESGQSAFGASGEAVFRIRAGDGVATVETIKGSVKAESFQEADVFARAVNVPLSRNQPQVALDVIAARRRERKRILVQVTKRLRSGSTSIREVSYTDSAAFNSIRPQQGEEVEPGRTLTFTVNPPIGTIEAPRGVTSDASGLIEIFFTGITTGSATIRGEIERRSGDGQLNHLNLTINVEKVPIYMRKSFLAAAVATAVVVVVIVKVRRPEERGPLIQQPPPVID